MAEFTKETIYIPKENELLWNELKGEKGLLGIGLGKYVIKIIAGFRKKYPALYRDVVNQIKGEYDGSGEDI